MLLNNASHTTIATLQQALDALTPDDDVQEVLRQLATDHHVQLVYDVVHDQLDLAATTLHALAPNLALPICYQVLVAASLKRVLTPAV